MDTEKRMAGLGSYVKSIYYGGSFILLQQRGQNFDDCRLACSVVSKQGENAT